MPQKDRYLGDTRRGRGVANPSRRALIGLPRAGGQPQASTEITAAPAEEIGANPRRSPAPEGGARPISREVTTRRGFLARLGIGAGFLLGGVGAFNYFSMHRPTDMDFSSQPEIAMQFLDLVLNDKEIGSSADTLYKIATTREPRQYDIDQLHILKDIIGKAYGGGPEEVRPLQRLVVQQMGDFGLTPEQIEIYGRDPYRDDGRCAVPLEFLRVGPFAPRVRQYVCFDQITSAAFHPDPQVLRRVVDQRDNYLSELERLGTTGSESRHQGIDRFAESLVNRGYDKAKALEIAMALKKYSIND